MRQFALWPMEDFWVVCPEMANRAITRFPILEVWAPAVRSPSSAALWTDSVTDNWLVVYKGTSRQRSGKGAIRKRFPLQKPRWEKTKLTIRYLYHETYRKPNEQLFSQ